MPVPTSDELETGLLLFALTFGLGVLPLVRRWSERGLHVLVSVSAGVFLGLVFLHLLPELAAGHAGSGAGDAGELGSASHGWSSRLPWAFALGGFLTLFFLGRVWPHEPGHASADAERRHRAVWTATFIGLVIHSAVNGLSLGLLSGTPGTMTAMLVATAAHKGSEAFSLATLMRLAGLSTPAALLFLAVHALAAPVGMWLGAEFALADSLASSLCAGFACGTLLYVAALDLLPEVFHGARRTLAPALGVVLGVLAAGAGEAPFGFLIGDGLAVLAAAWDALRQMAPWLLLGFLVGGLVVQFLRPELFKRWLEREGPRSAGVAALIGAPLPLCSCSVVPVGMALRKLGASRSATSSFMISTPETGVDSLAVSWALLDPLLTAARFGGALISALVTGTIVGRWGGSAAESSAPAQRGASGAAASCCATAAPRPDSKHGLAARLAAALRTAGMSLMDDLAPYLAVGLLVAGALAVALPVDALESPLFSGWSGLVVMWLVSMPMYVCAAASTPIAAALILKGLSPGAALVFLLAGPATNAGSVVALVRVLGRRAALLHLAVLAVVTLALGWATDALYAALAIAPSARVTPHEHGGLGDWFYTGAALLVLALLAGSLARWILRPPDAGPGDCAHAPATACHEPT